MKRCHQQTKSMGNATSGYVKSNTLRKGEKVMKKTSAFIAVLVMAVLLSSVFILGTQTAHAKKPILLRLVVPAPPGDWPLTYKDMELAKRFNERVKGEYVMEVHAGGAMAKLPEYFDAVRIGAVEMADSPWGMFSHLDPRLGLIETPFLFNSMDAATAAIKHLLPLYDQILQEKFNAKGLALMNTGGIQLFSTKPVKTLEDWKGLLVGGISPTTSEMIKYLGGSPVTIMWTDMYEALQKKVIDATTQGTHGALVMGMMDVCKHATIFFGVAAWNGFSINLDVWKKMPKHIQNILQEEIDWTADWMNKTTGTVVGDNDMKAFKEKGYQSISCPMMSGKDGLSCLLHIKKSKLGDLGNLAKR
jgi:TRAP-type C4-dicarboxylate transport system substrate-binding protein